MVRCELGQSKDCPFFYKLENSMPIYQYKNEETGEVTDKFMSISDMEQFEIDNPHMKKIIQPVAFGDAMKFKLGIKTSVFFLTPAAIRDKCSALVPLMVGKIYFDLVIFFSLFVNSSL